MPASGMHFALVPSALHPPALNPHLTKSRLNDAPRLCEMLWNFSIHGSSRAGQGSNVPLQMPAIERCLEGEQVGASLDARRMSTSTVASFAASRPKRSSRKASPHHL